MNARIRGLWFSTLAIASLLVVSGCSSQSPGEGGDATGSTGGDSAGTISIGLVPVADSAAVYIADDAGYFEEEGLEVEIKNMQNGAAIVPAILNGQIQFGNASIVPIISAISTDVPISVVANAVNVPSSRDDDFSSISVAADSGIESPRDLEGKTVAVNAMGAIAELVVRNAILLDGGDPSAVEFVVMPLPNSVSAIDEGDVDAAMLVEPFVSEGDQAGLRTISAPYFESLVAEGTVSVYFSSSEYIQQNPDVVESFANAIRKASEDADEDPTLIREVLKQNGGLSGDLADNMKLPAFLPAELSREALESISEDMMDLGMIESVPSLSELLAE